MLRLYKNMLICHVSLCDPVEGHGATTLNLVALVVV